MPISHSVGPSLGGSYTRSPMSMSQPVFDGHQNAIDNVISNLFMKKEREKLEPGVMVIATSFL